MFLLSLLACGSGWLESESCGLNPYAWSDDLLSHVLTGDASGSFDYDPVDAPRVNLAGSYDPSTGDFSWKEAFDQDYYLVSSSVEGYGTVYHQGDLDVEYDVTRVDVLDNEATSTVRMKREGCGTEWWSWSEDDQSDLFHQAGEYDSTTSFHWTAEDDSWDYEGSFASDLSSTTRYVAKDDTWEETHESRPDGTAGTTFSGSSGCIISDTECDGETESDFDGGYSFSSAMTQDGDAYADASGAFNYAGTGTLTIDYDVGVSCDYEFKDGACTTYSCDNGDDGSCG